MNEELINMGDAMEHETLVVRGGSGTGTTIGWDGVVHS